MPASGKAWLLRDRHGPDGNRREEKDAQHDPPSISRVADHQADIDQYRPGLADKVAYFLTASNKIDDHESGHEQPQRTARSFRVHFTGFKLARICL
jgi:hypothetical protein